MKKIEISSELKKFTLSETALLEVNGGWEWSSVGYAIGWVLKSVEVNGESISRIV